MKSPLQAAHDQAAAEPVVCTVAAPRQPAPPSTYTGAELSTRSSRPGAYDALALPSLMNGRKRVPGDHEPATPYVPREAAYRPLNVSPRAEASEPPKLSREFSTVHQVSSEYRPHPGSTPAKVLDHLRAMGGFISHAEICERFGITRSSITGAFKPALKRGVLVRQVVDGYTGFSLPGWKDPASGDAGDPAQPQQGQQQLNVGGLATTKMLKEAAASRAATNILFASGAAEFLAPSVGNRRFWPISGEAVAGDDAASPDPVAQSALYELMLRETEQCLLARYIAVLQLRQQLFDAIRLFPLPPLTEPPRLTDAA